MVASARWKVWETNSSSVHQLVLNLNSAKFDDVHCKLIIRLRADSDLYNSFNYPDDWKNADIQIKLDFIIVNIITYCRFNGNIGESVYYTLRLKSILEEHGFDVDIDVDSFSKDVSWLPEPVEEIPCELIKWIDDATNIINMLTCDWYYIMADRDDFYSGRIKGAYTKETQDKNVLVMTEYI